MNAATNHRRIQQRTCKRILTPYAFVIGAAAAAMVCLAGGCNDPSNGRLEVAGSVTLNRVPLDRGVITFYDPAGNHPSSGAAIVDGKYHLPAGKGLLPGDYKVAIDSADASGETASPVQYSMRIPVSRIPAKYNGETMLSAEVTSTGANQFDFDLTTGGDDVRAEFTR
jgi:hypothetical protein